MAPRIADWDGRIGRRLKLRDLHVLFAVMQFGSMAKAASHLAVTQPAVSQAIADLEAALGVRLLDRGPRGVTPTLYGEALLKHGLGAFDALKQAVREIEFLAEAGSGEVWIGASESYIAGGFLSAIIQNMSLRHPRISVHVLEANTAELEFQELRDRKVDLMLGRISGPIADDDLHVETLFEEAIFVAAGAQNPWVRRRKIELAQLADEPWILAPPNTVVRSLIDHAFHVKGLRLPRVSVTTYSMQLRLQLLTSGPYLTVFPGSLLAYNANRWPIGALPVDVGRPLPVAIITLKNRTLGPTVQVFIEHARAVTRTMNSSMGET